jgi:hypothetical protein
LEDRDDNGQPGLGRLSCVEGRVPTVIQLPKLHTRVRFPSPAPGLKHLVIRALPQLLEGSSVVQQRNSYNGRTNLAFPTVAGATMGISSGSVGGCKNGGANPFLSAT